MRRFDLQSRLIIAGMVLVYFGSVIGGLHAIGVI